jgi:Tol biopolymer transport system component
VKTPETSKLFKKWRDTKSGVESFILNPDSIPFVQSCYFVNTSYTNDGRYLWFYSLFPPSGSKCLGFVDFENDSVRFLPETQFLDASPMIDLENGDAYWISKTELWKISPVPRAKPVLLNRFPDELAKSRRPHRISTHLTFSADSKTLSLDAQIGNEWYVGAFPLDGRSPEIWQKITDCCANHAQSSPTDPELLMFANDGWNDAATGEKHDYAKRIWLIRKGGKAEPVFKEITPMHGHEWWDPDGKYIWYINYGTGTEKVDIKTRTRELVWPSKCVSHSHSDKDGKYIVSDISAHNINNECRVEFVDLSRQKTIDIVSSMPTMNELKKYHIHPHPQFCLKDRYVCYTTTVQGRVSVALTSVSSILQMQ